MHLKNIRLNNEFAVPHWQINKISPLCANPTKMVKKCQSLYYSL